MSSAVSVLTGISDLPHVHQALHARRVEKAIEAICSLGCRDVHGVIARLEAGEPVAETASLTRFEKERVIEELKDVMSVYAYRCTID